MDHTDFIECSAENPEYGEPRWHDQIQLNVTFAPQFLGMQTGEKREIVEGRLNKIDRCLL
ncbi:unnamed protein product [Protopolystoma xenopodis]|uniref:Uncharacterized protein n=1 Tax=Protopolystoma xenopodis TaxID=117903 RepID=A0A3S5AME1_9PLAT|nr:unnamed protein product [Protopolystoma xenopodis]